MTFALPRNIPSFSDPQRAVEDQLWSASGVATRGNRSMRSGLLPGGRIAGFLDANDTLPMYKDKPYAFGRRTAPSAWHSWRYRRIFVIALVALVVLGLYAIGAFHKKRSIATSQWPWLKASEPSEPVDWLERRGHVVEAFKTSWDAYATNAWGLDEYHPISKTGRKMSPKGLGWIIIDSLDTMMLMNLTSRVIDARKWLKTLSWNQDQDVNTFETTIRIVGGLLSAHYLSTEFPSLAQLSSDDKSATGGDGLYLDQARDLANRLLPAFDSPSGIPFASVQLDQMRGIRSHQSMGASSTSEATTLQLEFKYLAKLTGERKFWDKAERAIATVESNEAVDGLVPIFVEPDSGRFVGKNIRLGSRADSYYEYLLKQFLQTSGEEPVYEQLWSEALDGVRRHLLTYTASSGFTILGERPAGLSGRLMGKMDHLVCFMPGTIALGVTGGATEAAARSSLGKRWTTRHTEHMRLARELMLTCWGMYRATATGLAGEITHFRIENSPPPWEPGGRKSGPSPPDELALRPAPPPGHNGPATASWHDDFVVKPADSHNLQRPETVESLFYMWRITGDERYRRWGWEMFVSFMNHTAVADNDGFTCLNNADVVPPEVRDNMESFWLAETLKYFYLLFSPADLLPLDQVVFNTEAHPFPRFSMGPLFSTGWTRHRLSAQKSL